MKYRFSTGSSRLLICATKGRRLGGTSQAKVHDLRRCRIGEENIRRLDVAMDQTLCMRGLQTFRDLDCGLQNFRFGKLLPLFDGIVETPVIDQLHDKIKLPVVASE